jgi:hypothetical protein
MDKFVKMVIEAALTHAEYRESSTITLTDVLESLKILGRPGTTMFLRNQTKVSPNYIQIFCSLLEFRDH